MKTQKRGKKEGIQSLWYQAGVAMIRLSCHQRKGDTILQTHPPQEDVAMTPQTHPPQEEVVMTLQTCHLQGNIQGNRGRRKVKVSVVKSFFKSF